MVSLLGAAHTLRYLLSLPCLSAATHCLTCQAGHRDTGGERRHVVDSVVVTWTGGDEDLVKHTSSLVQQQAPGVPVGEASREH